MRADLGNETLEKHHVEAVRILERIEDGKPRFDAQEDCGIAASLVQVHQQRPVGSGGRPDNGCGIDRNRRRPNPSLGADDREHPSGAPRSLSNDSMYGFFEVGLGDRLADQLVDARSHGFEQQRRLERRRHDDNPGFGVVPSQRGE